MPTFTFEAVDSKGQQVKKEIDAPDKEEAMMKIKDLGYFPTKVKEKSGGGGGAAPDGAAKKKGGMYFGGVPLAQLAAFTTQLSTLQDAGLPIVRSIRILEGQLKPSLLKNTLSEVADDVEGGSTLSEAFGKHPKAFNRLYVNMIKAGEAGGVLDVILERLALFMEKDLKLKKKIKGALVYPCVVTVVAVLIVAGIMKFVIPAFKKMFEETGLELPAMTQLLLTMAGFVENFWWTLPLFPFLMWVGIKIANSTPKGALFVDKVKLHLPVFGIIIRLGTISRMCRTLGTLIASGVPILEALTITRDALGNAVIAAAIDDVHASIREGESIARPLQQSGNFDDMLVNMVDIGEETGELDKMLIKIADNYDNDVDVIVEALTSIIEPILIVGMGITVGFIVIALFMPLLELINKL
ncbi:MAG: type II secretion system F family protein [Planctomycetota bacterium]|nr:type II secretion system F family protein [Planctomycetota bacterium]